MGKCVFVFSFLLLFLAPDQAHSQDEGSDEFYLNITNINSREGNTVEVSINYGSNIGIQKGMDCSAWGQYYSDYPTHNQSILAKGSIISASRTSATAVLTEFDTTSLSQVYEGDLIKLQLPGKVGYKGIFYELFQKSIFFVDTKNDTLFTFQDVFSFNSVEQEQEILEDASADIRIVGESLIGEIEDQQVEGGIFDGETMLNAMMQTTSRDFLSFLRYTNSDPEEYMGKSTNIYEAYVTWILVESPFLQSDLIELIDSLDILGTDHDSFFSRYGPLLDANMVLNLGLYAENLAETGDFKNAQKLMSKLITLAEMSENPDNIGWAYFQQARVFYLEGNKRERVNWHLKAKSNFESTDNDYALTYSYHNLGSAYYSLGLWKESIEYFLKAVELKVRFYESDPSTENLEDLAFSQYNLGDAYFEQGEYDAALKEFEKALVAYRSTGNMDKTIEMMEFRANCFAISGNLEEAIAIHKERIALGDEDVKADATFDIGYVYNGYGEDYLKAIPAYKESYDLHLALGDTDMATLSLSNVAQTYWSLKDLEMSIEYHKETIALAEAYGEKSRIADSWSKLASLYNENGNPKQSLEAYNRVIELYKELEDPLLAETLNEVGDVYKEAKDYQKAMDFFQRSLEIARENGDYIHSADALNNIGSTYFKEERYDLAMDFYQESMQEAKLTNYTSHEIYCLANIAVIFGIRDQNQKADSIFSIALKKAELLDDNNIIAFCKYRLGGTAARQRDYEKAEQLYTESLNLYRELEDPSGQVSTIQVLSGIYSNRGEFQMALQLLDSAMKIAARENDRNNMAYIYVFKSDIYLRVLGEFEKAWDMQEQSMKLFEEVDNSWGIADSYLGFGNIKNLSGEYEEAIRYYTKSDSLYAVLGNEQSRATPANNIGTIYYWQVDYENALKYFNQAIAILDKLDIRDALRSMYVSNVGAVYLEQKKFDESEKWMKEALYDAREIQDVNQISTNLTYLGKLKTETNEYDQARKYLEEALQLEEKVGLKTHKITSNFAMGKLAYLNKQSDAKKYIDESIRLSLIMGSDKELWEAYYYKALIARDQGRLEESKEYFIDAIETLEKIQSKVVGGAEAKKLFSSGERQITVYASLVDLLILKGEIDLALQYLERSNIESLRSKFAQLDIAFKDKELNEKLEKEKELKRKLDNLERSIADEKASLSNSEKIQKLEVNRSVAENEYLKFVNQTINTNPELSQHFSGGFHPRQLKTDKNRRLIPDELMVLSYLPANDKLYIFAATSDTVIAKIVNVEMADLNKNIRFIYNFASLGVDGHQTDALRVARGEDSSPPPTQFNTTDSQFKEISEKLFNWTIAPVREELDKKSRVAVIPTGMLHFLPFQMLGERLSNGKFDYLIENYTLFYAHSLEMLYQHQDQTADISILAMANADNTLAGAEKEIMDLKEMYPATDTFVHEEASEDKVKSHFGKHNILHFATHGNLDYFDYSKSYLTLAPNADGTEDGKLTIEEVWEIEDIYEYRMVTLSACKTAVTDDFSTGWAVSPASSFIDAGAPTVVASLWAVNDASTGLLMKYFYGNLRTMSKVEALRRAQIQLSQNDQFRHPYYWSPFILIGDWR